MKASENHLGEVGLRHIRVQGSFTRPANTTAYATGDVMNDSTSAPTVATITNVARKPGAGGRIVSAQLHSSQNGTWADIDVFIFSATIASPGNDNAAFTPSDAEMLTLQTVLKFPAANAVIGNATAAAGGNSFIPLPDLSRVFQCAANTTTLYWVPVARGSYTPVSAEVFTLVLGVETD
ncbi:MAG TPA: hypothetical protein VD994_12965 [Prosthecobacter sp.]|nr:hypothetical protein [Prosthecobacter sp.]